MTYCGGQKSIDNRVFGGFSSEIGHISPKPITIFWRFLTLEKNTIKEVNFHPTKIKKFIELSTTDCT